MTKSKKLKKTAKTNGGKKSKKTTRSNRGKKLKKTVKIKTERIQPDESGEEEREEREEPPAKKPRTSFDLPAGFTIIKRTSRTKSYKEYLGPDGTNNLRWNFAIFNSNISGRKYRSLLAIQREFAQGSEADYDHENNMEDIDYKLEPEVNIEEEKDESDD